MSKVILNLISLAALSAAPALAQESHVDQLAVEQMAAFDGIEAGFNHADDLKGLFHQHPCKQLNMTDAQKSATREAAAKAKREAVTIGAALKVANMDYAALITNNGADAAAAEAVGNKVLDAKSKLMANQMAFKSTLLFTILRAEQRPLAVKCMKAMHRHGHAHH